MISSEPDPERKTFNPVITVTWTTQARREYSRLASTAPSPWPTRAALNALAKRAISQTLQDAPAKMEVLAALKNPAYSLDVSFVGDAEITELNAQHRGKNKPTDVLSFSQLEGEWMPFGDFADDDEILLGDVIISIEAAARQADELKHDLGHETAFLVAHGVLHLLGYDHDTSARRRAMFALQDKIVATLESQKPAARKAVSRKTTTSKQAVSSS